MTQQERLAKSLAKIQAAQTRVDEAKYQLDAINDELDAIHEAIEQEQDGHDAHGLPFAIRDEVEEDPC